MWGELSVLVDYVVVTIVDERMVVSVEELLSGMLEEVCAGEKSKSDISYKHE